MAARRRTPRKQTSRSRDYEKDFEDRMEEFGKFMEERGKDIGKEVQDIFENFGKNTEKREEGRWWFKTFGFIWPIIKSIFGVVFLCIGILALNFINIALQSWFISSLSDLIFSNIQWFFVIFLFFGYNDYLAKVLGRRFWILRPLTSAVGLTLMLWVLSLLLYAINYALTSNFISFLSYALYSNLLNLFILFAVLGYTIALIKTFIMYNWRNVKNARKS